jgi:hypothetical protein
MKSLRLLSFSLQTTPELEFGTSSPSTVLVVAAQDDRRGNPLLRGF